ncbi:unnamed protein product, partial [Mesorhabditis spiculigera]
MADVQPDTVAEENGGNENKKSTVEVKTEPETFSWDSYLKEFNATAAPSRAFYQSEEPPRNDFEVGALLTVPDAKGGNMPCLGSVQAVSGRWIFIRLEGTDNSDDHWVMCDDTEIAPIGEETLLNPPVGFRISLRTFHSWKDKMLTTHHLARPEWFRPIDKKFRPPKCLFEEGQKLEVMDTKNFCGQPYVATIVKVSQNGQLQIHFDGWASSYDIEQHFQSRNLFPVGWSARAGLEVAAMSMHSLRAEARRTQAKSQKKTQSVSPTSIPTQKPSPQPTTQKRPAAPPMQRLSDVGANPTNRPGVPAKIKCVAPRVPPARPSVESRKTETPTEDVEQDVKPPRQKSVSPALGLLNPRHSTIPKAPDGKAADVLLSCGDSVPVIQRSMVVHINRNCHPGQYLDPKRLAELPKAIGPLSIHHVVREATQQLINCGIEQALVYRRVEAGAVTILSVSAQVQGFTHVRFIPIVKNVSVAWNYLRKLTAKLGCCPNLYSDSPLPCTQCQSKNNANENLKVKVEDTIFADTTESPSPNQTSQPFVEWSVDKLQEEMRGKFDANIVETFKEHMIDGRALALLNFETIKNHMDIPTGPALKLDGYIKSLKGQSA